MPDRRDHGRGRFVEGVEAQIAPRQLEVLPMAEAAASLEDLVEDLKITFPDPPDGSCGARNLQQTRYAATA